MCRLLGKFTSLKPWTFFKWLFHSSLPKYMFLQLHNILDYSSFLQFLPFLLISFPSHGHSDLNTCGGK
ncbi:hypothetical protein AQUCO_01600282v1 [Aquilegia coerulea]|uniref:Uncharacterized protein n=1 Tax=Aquilegia coerulea TaxID=218851 RepID=A0A2G5DQX7_AQUCA|nr:hypothetical protein AQUCO_01600282v1 [Aquilegia coerulea]